MESTYLTTFKGEIDVGGLNPAIITTLETFVEEHLKDIANVDRDTGMIYISGSIDNSDELMEKFIFKLSAILYPEKQIVIEAQGEDPKDRWDLLLDKYSAFKQEYVFRKGDIIELEY